MKKTIYAYLKQNWILLLILSVGFILRIIGLNTKSIWYDEACSVDFCQNSWVEILSHRYMLRPLYFIILKLWTGLFGYQEFVLRMPSVFFAVGSIFLIYFLAKKLFSKKVGLFSAFFLAVSPYHIIRSQDARGYTLLMFLVCMVTLVFWDIVKNKKQSYLCYVMIMVLMFLNNFFAGFMIFLVHNLIFLFEQKKYKRWILSQCLIIIISAAILLPFAKYYYLEMYNDQFCQPEYNNVMINLFEDFSYARKVNQGGIGNYGLAEISPLRKANYYLILGLLIYVLVKYFISARRDKTVSRKTVFLLVWFFLPLTVFLLVNMFIPVSKWSKTAIIILPAFYILISQALSRLSKKIVIVFIGLYIIFSICSINYIYSTAKISSWKQVAANVQGNISAKDMILFAPAHLLVPFWYYYMYGDNFAFLQIGDGDCGQFAMVDGSWQMEFKNQTNLIRGLSFEFPGGIINELELLQNDYNGVWLIIGYWFGQDNMEKLIKSFSQDYVQVSKKEFPVQAVWLYHFVLK